jgi:DNA-directed RNA polymerase beta subunit
MSFYSDFYTNAIQDAALQSHERMFNYATDQIAHFENFIQFRMPFIIQEHGRLDILCLETKERHYINLTNVVTKRPMIDNSDPSVRALRAGVLDILKPEEARDRGLTYSGRILVDVEHTIFSTDDKGVATEQKSVTTVYREMPLFEMPMMLRSKFCHASVDAKKECWLDMGGYFIVRGNPKVLQPQKTQRINVHLVKGVTRGAVDADIRSLRADEKYRSTSTLYLHLVGSPSSITVDVPFLETGMPIVAIFRMLGFETQEMIESILWCGEIREEDQDSIEKMEAKRRVFSTNFSHPLAFLPLIQVFDAASVGLKCPDPTPEKLRKQVMQQITGELLPHVGYDDLPITRLKKAVYLSIIIRRMIDVHLGYEETDDRDFEGYKSVQMSAGILSVMFRQQFAACMKLLRNSVYKRSKMGKSLDLSVILGGSDTLSRDILKAFSEGEVTVQKDASNAGTSVIQLAIQVNPLGIQTHIQRVSTPLPRAGKYKQLRGVDATQLFCFCLADDHEVLTNRGFMGMNELLRLWGNDLRAPPIDSGLLLAGYDKVTFQFVYERPLSFIYNEAVDQEMIDFTQATYRCDGTYDEGISNYVSLLTTPEHDMYVRRGTSCGGKRVRFVSRKNYTETPMPFEKVKAMNLEGFGSPAAIQFLGQATGGVKFLESPEPPPYNRLSVSSLEQKIAFCELFGYWLGDGTISCTKHYFWRTSFNIVKLHDIAWLKKIFEILGLEWNMTGPSKNSKQVLISISDLKYNEWFIECYGQRYAPLRPIDEKIIKSAKWMQPWVWGLDITHARAILSGIRRADGDEASDDKTIYTSSTKFRDEIVRLALHSGYTASFLMKYPAGTCRGQINGTKLIANHASWAVHYAEDKQFAQPTLKRATQDIRRVRYAGPTWCVTMPSSFLLTRRATKDDDGIVQSASRPLIIHNCPAETPEGEGCGLLQNLATFAHVRVGTDLKIVEKSLQGLYAFASSLRAKLGFSSYSTKADELVRPFRTLSDLQETWGVKPTIIFVNSDPVAVTVNVEEFIDASRLARRHGFLPFDCSIVRATHGICISTDMGVVTFPLIHLQSLHFLQDALDSARGGREELWAAIRRLGIVEYIDAWEMLEYRVAFKPEEVDRSIELQDPFPYSHMAVHPSSFLGTCASSVPFSDHDQAPRVSYQSGMLKQAVSTPATNIADRMDFGYAHVLWYPQRPMADTAIAHAKKINDWPMGENFIVAIAPFLGLSQEDSIIRNRASVERGSGRISVYRMFKTVARKRGTEQEIFEHPFFLGLKKELSACEGIRGNVCYDKIGMDGLPEPGTPIMNNDVIVGKVAHTQEVQADGSIKDVRRDKSVIMCCEDSETFIIDKVMVSTTKEGMRTVRIRAKTTRSPQEGDKLSSRHGQKGTIGILMNEEDMPYVMNGPNAGMRTDVIINLHCFAEDTEVLTNWGFMNLSQVEKNYNNENFLVASYDHSSKHLLYERPCALIVNPSKMQEMIEFTQEAEAHRWGTNVYGLSDVRANGIQSSISNDEPFRTGYGGRAVPRSNGVSLIVTPNHDMFIKRGISYSKGITRVDGTLKKCIKWESSNFLKQTANSSLPVDSRSTIKMISYFPNGVVNSSTQLPFAAKLGLSSIEQQTAFCELYGYWLGDGCLQFNSVFFNPVKTKDDVWLSERFQTLQPLKYTRIVRETDDGKIRYEWRISEKSWFDFFCSEYGKKYKRYNGDVLITSTTEPENVKSAKWIASWVWNLSCFLSRCIIRGLRFADGCEAHDINVIYTSSTRFRDEVMRLTLHAGYSSHFVLRHAKGQCLSYINNCKVVANFDGWDVRYAECSMYAKPVLHAKTDIKTINYNGKTWCLTMPHGFLIARRAHKNEDGVVTKASRPIITGNCMNGRMTVGWLLEMVMSNLGLVKGNFIDATPFRKVNAKWAVEELIKAGFGVEETMCNGMTGEVMEGKWFIGCSFYQMLKHMVLDKITSRQRGGRAALTRQPLDGRANKGGQRLGEMEKDALLSHGAAFVLDDRSRIASDAHSALVCKTCGHVGESRDETLRTLTFDVQNSGIQCALCGTKNSSVTLPTTYCYSGLLLRELATVGIKVMHSFSPISSTLKLELENDELKTSSVDNTQMDQGMIDILEEDENEDEEMESLQFEEH